MSRKAIDVAGQSVVDLLQDRFDEYGVTTHVLTTSIEPKLGFILAINHVAVLVALEDFALDLAELQPLHLELRDDDGPLLDHRSHAMVGELGEFDEHEDLLRASMAVLRVASVLSETPGASAVLWSPAESLTPPGAFRMLVAQATADAESLPLPILARTVAYQDGVTGTTPMFGVVATGFYKFFGRDIEFVRKARSLREMVDSYELVATWLMLKGLVFKDGDTCGGSATETIRVHYKDQGLVLRRPILMFDIEKLEPNLSSMPN